MQNPSLSDTLFTYFHWDANMFAWMHKATSPKTAYRWAERCQPWLMVGCLLTFFYALVDGLLFAPPDYQQGNAFRIMYLHVPAAIWSLLIYIIMSIAVIVFLVWKIKLADVIAKISAPIGALFTAICLITGAIWGRPTWGAWWIWDARLTSELLLLFIYFAIIALRSVLPSPAFAARASGFFTLIALVNIPIIHYSVNWWNTLHQGSSLSLLSATIAPGMLHPLLAMIVAFAFYYGWMLCIKIRSELLLREKGTAWVQAELLEEK